MTDRPILFSAPMIQALLAGRKTQTRRLASSSTRPTHPGSDDLLWRPSPWRKVQPGDRLWVREAWCHEADEGALIPGKALYQADGQHVAKTDGDGFAVTLADGREASPWRPSIHMPRWASRLTLTVTDVRVQRLQEISEADATAEGVEPFVWLGVSLPTPHRYNFELLWNDLHGPAAWLKNPEVVGLTFTVEQRNIDTPPRCEAV